MRGQVFLARRRLSARWITPADAGTRSFRAHSLSLLLDHPRGCGDKVVRGLHEAPFPGSPPRMRGQDAEITDALPGGRITPADAGTRSADQALSFMCRDHPRGCGDKQSAKPQIRHAVGSPPRMRGQGSQHGCKPGTLGITPADAGTRRTKTARFRGWGITPADAGTRLSWSP